MASRFTIAALIFAGLPYAASAQEQVTAGTTSGTIIAQSQVPTAHQSSKVGQPRINPANRPRINPVGTSSSVGIGVGVAIGVLGRARRQPSGEIRSLTGNAAGLDMTRSSERQANRAVQEALNHLGFEAGRPDGVIGRRTQYAISQFQASLGRDASGSLTHEERLLLLGAFSTSVATESDPSLLAGTDFHVATESDPTPISGIGSHVSGLGTRMAFQNPIDVSWTRGDIYATRLFAGPNGYPPTDFAAYGILAFTSRASPRDRERHLLICQAYVNSVRLFSAIQKPTTEQMVTVWPLASDAIAESLFQKSDDEVCSGAVDGYGSVTADRAIRHAALAGAELSGLGPFLIAWSPPKKKGEKDAVVLVANLSGIHDYDAALKVMLQWVQDIERDPELWARGWNRSSLTRKIQRWFDHRGTLLLRVFSGS